MDFTDGRIEIKRNDRAFFGGMTGSGKTYAAKLLLEQHKYVVVLDNKGLFNWRGAGLVTKFDKLDKASQSHERIVYRPPAELEANRTEFLETMDAFFWWVYNRENCILYVDEATSVCDAYNITAGHNAIMRRGRELNIGCWNASQQPVNCHNTIISEAEHLLIFYLSLESHRKKVAGIMGDEVLRYNPSKKDHGFWYMDQAHMENPVLHRAL